VLSLFVPSQAMAAAWDKLAVKPELAQRYIVGGETTVAHGLALAWGEQRFARRRRDPFDDALALFVAGWLWRHYGMPAVADDLGVHLRRALGADGATVAAFFERHLADQPFPWPALATALGTSTRTLQRRFVDAMGASPSAVLQRFRLDRARDWLRDPSRPVGDVAMAAGFSSQAHFATAFRAAFGVSPTAFRRGRE
jgi:transcriptional regulator GlxA family with amidase domain